MPSDAYELIEEKIEKIFDKARTSGIKKLAYGTDANLMVSNGEGNLQVFFKDENGMFLGKVPFHDKDEKEYSIKVLQKRLIEEKFAEKELEVISLGTSEAKERPQKKIVIEQKSEKSDKDKTKGSKKESTLTVAAANIRTTEDKISELLPVIEHFSRDDDRLGVIGPDIRAVTDENKKITIGYSCAIQLTYESKEPIAKALLFNTQEAAELASDILKQKIEMMNLRRLPVNEYNTEMISKMHAESFARPEKESEKKYVEPEEQKTPDSKPADLKLRPTKRITQTAATLPSAPPLDIEQLKKERESQQEEKKQGSGLEPREKNSIDLTRFAFATPSSTGTLLGKIDKDIAAMDPDKVKKGEIGINHSCITIQYIDKTGSASDKSTYMLSQNETNFDAVKKAIGTILLSYNICPDLTTLSRNARM